VFGSLQVEVGSAAIRQSRRIEVVVFSARRSVGHSDERHENFDIMPQSAEH
jgi:hypothetical protein